MPGARTLIAVDNHEAGRSLGRWAGQYVTQYFAGSARVLDLSYHLSNTQERSSGFADGLRETASDAPDCSCRSIPRPTGARPTS